MRNNNDLIEGSSFPVLRLGKNVIWDLTDLVNADWHEILSSDTITEPTKLDQDHITFCKCSFNTRSLIYENATPEDILSAWETVKDELKLNRLVKLFLRDSMQNLRLTRNLYLEPDLILILRLVYWYYYCKSLDTSFIHKIKEVREGLIRGRLTNREGISRQLDADLTDKEVTDLESILLKNNALEEEADKLRTKWFINTWNVTSELLFAGVLGKNGFDVTYVPKSKTHDYDFLVNHLPVQVYSFNTPVLVESVASSEIQRKSYVEENKLSYDLAINMVKGSIQDKSSELDDKLAQGAKIIMVNGTSDESGRFFSQHFFNSGGSYTFDRSVRASIDLAASDETALPIMYCSTGFRLIYYVFSVPFKVRLSVVDDQRKVDRKINIDVIECP